MKKPKQVKVVANSPCPNQVGIEPLIGETLNVERSDSETGEVWVTSEYFGGQIALNRGEYEVVQ